MSLINKRAARALIALLSALTLSAGALAEGMLIADEDIVRDTANYRTTQVELGVYKKTISSSASEYYPTQYSVKYTGAGARYVRTVVKRGTQVEAGDLIAEFEVERDEVRISRARLELTRAQEAYQAGCEQREEQLEDKRLAQLSAQDTYAAEILRIEHRQLQLSYELYRLEQERSLSQKREALDELLASYENTQIFAPISGVVYDITYFRDGQMVYDGTVLAHIYDPTDLMFYVNDEAGVFRYNMPVTIEVGVNRYRVSGKGRVVASYNALPSEASGKEVYVRVTEYNADEVTSLTRPVVSADTVYLGNVMIAARGAITLFGGKHFVYKLTDGRMVSKRYVNYAAGTSATGAWLLQGVEPGDVLILD